MSHRGWKALLAAMTAAFLLAACSHARSPLTASHYSVRPNGHSAKLHPGTAIGSSAFCRDAAQAAVATGVPAPVAFSGAAAELTALARQAPAEVRSDAASLAAGMNRLARRLSQAPGPAGGLPASFLGSLEGADVSGASTRLQDYAGRRCPAVAAVRLPPAPRGQVRLTLAVERTGTASAAAPAGGAQVEVRGQWTGGPAAARSTGTTRPGAAGLDCARDFSYSPGGSQRPCAALVPSGRTVTLVAGTPFGRIGPDGVGPGLYEFSHWEGSCRGTRPVCSLAARGRPSVTAVYRPVPELLVETRGTGEVVVAASGAGRAAGCSPPLAVSSPVPAGAGYPGSLCRRWYPAGTAVTLTARGGPGGRSGVPAFAGWAGASCSGGRGTCRVTLDAANGAQVVARFQYYWCPAPGGRSYPSMGGGSCVPGRSGPRPSGPVVPPGDPSASCPTTSAGGPAGMTGGGSAGALGRLVDLLAPERLVPGINDALHAVLAAGRFPASIASCP